MPAGVLLGAILAQALAAPGADAPDLDRIRQAVAETPAIVVDGHFDRPVFRVAVQGWKFNGPPWDDKASFVRPGMPGYHYDYLAMVTPEAFRAGTLYPASVGLPVGSLIESLGRKWRESRRRNAELKARAEVIEALETLRACRENPSAPGC